jgi:hypothetical protein
VSDSFLIASILNASGLFITDTLTYVWGGMAEEDTESSISRIIELKKVRHCQLSPLRPPRKKRETDIVTEGTIRR